MVEAPKTSGGLIGWFAGNSVTANLLMLFLMVGGWSIVSNLKTETFPEIDPNQITITVAYPGASPEEIEDAITRRIEEAVAGIEGIDRIRAVSTVGVGTVTLELKDFVDQQKVKDDINSAVDQIADFPPSDAEQPRVTIIEPVSNVLRLAVYGDVSEQALRVAAENLENDLLDLENVSLVELDGARAYEISIEVSEDKLREHGLTISEVSSAVSAGSIDLSAGTLRTRGGEILLRTDQDRRTGEDFADIVISSDTSGRTLYLKDVANIVDGFEEGQLKSLYKGLPAVFLRIGAGDDQDAFDISSEVMAMLRARPAMDGVAIDVVEDQTTVINDRLHLMIRNAVVGLVLVFVLLALTLDLRLAFWTSLGIPISFLGGFWIIGQFTTINMTTLFGLIVVLGIVVDDAIVVGENVFEEQERTGRKHQAAVSGALGVVAPVTIGVLTTMAAFAPLLFTTGTMGQILWPIPIVVLSVLFMSLLEAFFILPAHLAHGGTWSAGPLKKLKEYCHQGLFLFRDKIVLVAVRWAMRARYLTLGGGFVFLLLIMAPVRHGDVRFVFFPEVEADSVSALLVMEPGTPYEVTEEVMDRVAAAAIEAAGGEGSSDIENFRYTVGGQSGGGFGPSSGMTIGSQYGSATLSLTSADERSMSAADIERRWRELVGPVVGAESLSFSSSLVGGGADVSVDFWHADEDVLALAVDSFMKELSAIDGVEEEESGLDRGARQIEFALTPEGAAAGLKTSDIARQLRQAFFGDEVQRFLRGREEVKVYVRLPAEERTSLADLNRFRIRLADGTDIPLATVASLSESLSPTEIRRVDGRRRISVEADVDERVTTPNEVMEFISETVLSDLVATYPGLGYSFEGQSREQQEDLDSLSNGMLIGLLIIFVMLASVLRSYVQPIVIMIIIPFAAASAVLGHIIVGKDLSFLSMFGMVALSGVVINDSVVLIDYFNKQRHGTNLSVFDAAINAVSRRFRPILLTTLTTFFGLAPMLMETSIQAQFLIPMAISLAWGILFSGFLILLLVPALLLIIEDIDRIRRRIFRLGKSIVPAE